MATAHVASKHCAFPSATLAGLGDCARVRGMITLPLTKSWRFEQAVVIAGRFSSVGLLACRWWCVSEKSSKPFVYCACVFVVAIVLGSCSRELPKYLVGLCCAMLMFRICVAIKATQPCSEITAFARLFAKNLTTFVGSLDMCSWRTLPHP